MRLRDGRYECAYCGEVLDLPQLADPRVTIVAAGGQPNMRTLVIDGKEIHRCAIGDRASGPTAPLPSSPPL